MLRWVLVDLVGQAYLGNQLLPYRLDRLWDRTRPNHLDRPYRLVSQLLIYLVHPFDLFFLR